VSGSDPLQMYRRSWRTTIATAQNTPKAKPPSVNHGAVPAALSIQYPMPIAATTLMATAVPIQKTSTSLGEGFGELLSPPWDSP
jgi:hypothetical protein